MTALVEEQIDHIEYQEAIGSFQTPHGRPIKFFYREGTNDWNTVASCLGSNDEYGLRSLTVTGWAVDVGGYLGSVGITVAVDNPTARVLIVEPVPDNAALCRRNAELNGVSDRVYVFEGAAGKPGKSTSEIRFRYVGDPNLEHHAFVGNTSLAYEFGGDTPHLTRTVETLGLAALLKRFGITEPDFLKIDCEGGEWPFFTAARSDLLRLPLIVGEAHPVQGHVIDEIVTVLGATHDVTVDGWLFRAVRRG